MKNPFNFKRTKKVETPSSSRSYVEQTLPKAENKQAKVLRELLTNYKNGCSRHYLTTFTGVVNVPTAIRQLRKKGVEIITEKKPTINEFGRPVKYGIYKLADFKQGLKKYNAINDKLCKSKQAAKSLHMKKQ